MRIPARNIRRLFYEGHTEDLGIKSVRYPSDEVMHCSERTWNSIHAYYLIKSYIFQSIQYLASDISRPTVITISNACSHAQCTCAVASLS